MNRRPGDLEHSLQPSPRPPARLTRGTRHPGGGGRGILITGGICVNVTGWRVLTPRLEGDWKEICLLVYFLSVSLFRFLEWIKQEGNLPLCLSFLSLFLCVCLSFASQDRKKNRNEISPCLTLLSRVSLSLSSHDRQNRKDMSFFFCLAICVSVSFVLRRDRIVRNYVSVDLYVSLFSRMQRTGIKSVSVSPFSLSVSVPVPLFPFPGRRRRELNLSVSFCLSVCPQPSLSLFSQSKDKWHTTFPFLPRILGTM